MRRLKNYGCLILLTACSATSAWAHSEESSSGLMSGLTHPFFGMDHLLAMVAVGIVSVLLGGANVWRVPLCFVIAMAAGAWAGFSGWMLPLAEVGISCSVALLGMAIAWGDVARFCRAIFAPVFLFGLYHGYAHGLELPRSAIPVFYSMGFLVSTIFLHICGIFVGELALSVVWFGRTLRLLGLAMAGIGLWMIWNQIYKG